MSDAIYLLDKNGELIRLTESSYDSEAVLQELLAKYPDLLPGEQINSASPRKWLFIAREVGVPCAEEGADRWSLEGIGGQAFTFTFLSWKEAQRNKDGR
jgi:hypothetical protein